MANSINNLEFKQAAMELCRQTYLLFGSEKTSATKGKPVFKNRADWKSTLSHKVAKVMTDDAPGTVLSNALGEKLELIDTRLWAVTDHDESLRHARFLTPRRVADCLPIAVAYVLRARCPAHATPSDFYGWPSLFTAPARTT